MAPYVYLFPAEDAESNQVDDKHPEADQAELRQDVDEVLAFGRNQTDAVDDWGQRQES